LAHAEFSCCVCVCVCQSSFVRSRNYLMRMVKLP
jgi:hypothetical protein